ncbi:D-alanyl-D-alanine carboxypeptidase [Parazoarcus communis]|uniref:D-alanyl-D-alanine carboxypeptidase n=1 Tax=Parazoarcus communis TaxID=41977 RepID=A0A2U8GLM6_9RHOO|nr:M15 family metallopeptidase [Parazoarcus communis]AWI74073.1 D-alanyl-D-alanine carboxypeptidase [Parazoarcus communis]
MTLVLSACFLSIAAAVSLLGFASLRRALFGWVPPLMRGMSGPWQIGCAKARDAWRFATEGFLAAGRLIRRRMTFTLAALVLMSAPALLIPHFIAPFPHPEQVGGPTSGSRIAALLEGEQLSPPPPLPPDIFATREVEHLRPATPDANRDWMRLDTEFRQRLLAAFTLMRDRHGYETVLIEGYRSPARQNQLAALGDSVTRASAHQSYHQYGLAADCAFLREGRLVISERDPWAMQAYERLGRIAEELGLTWGGRWTLQDFGHVELRHPSAHDRRPRTAGNTLHLPTDDQS